MPTLQRTGQAPLFLSRSEEPGSAVPPAGLPSGAVCTLEAVACPRCARRCAVEPPTESAPAGRGASRQAPLSTGFPGGSGAGRSFLSRGPSQPGLAPAPPALAGGLWLAAVGKPSRGARAPGSRPFPWTRERPPTGDARLRLCSGGAPASVGLTGSVPPSRPLSAAASSPACSRCERAQKAL